VNFAIIWENDGMMQMMEIIPLLRRKYSRSAISVQ